jgi:hypothetical protein
MIRNVWATVFILAVDNGMEYFADSKPIGRGRVKPIGRLRVGRSRHRVVFYQSN